MSFQSVLSSIRCAIVGCAPRSASATFDEHEATIHDGRYYTECVELQSQRIVADAITLRQIG